MNNVINLKGELLTSTPIIIKEMKDYCQVGMDLLLQRQLIFGAALILAAFYYSVWHALVCLALIAVSEIYDLVLFRKILKWSGNEQSFTKGYLIQLCFSTTLSAGIISFYAIGISQLQGPTTHFMPLFFLFAAALFAAMNNHHLRIVLVIRLVVYGVTFIFIPAWDIYVTQANIHSELWAQMFTSLFVLYFIIDCSRIYLNFYKSNISQMEIIKSEHEKSKIALKAKSEFLSTMSHELRTPLTSIKGSIEMVNSGVLGDNSTQIKSVMNIAQRNCSRLVKLINEILDLQKIESGGMKYHFETKDVSKIVLDAIRTNQPYADKFGVTLSIFIESSDLLAQVDQSRLEQVFTNIISNASKFSQPGGCVKVRVKAIDSNIRIEFEDDGVGLSENDRDKVFDRFSQIDSSDSRKLGGTGLGMNISKAIIDAHDGILDYESKQGTGTLFFVELKRIDQTDKPKDKIVVKSI
jgi:signal transduction histidine kinase